MAESTLNRTGEQPPVVDRGRTTRDLGPGDSSDSGSDIVGGPGIRAEEADDALALDRGTTSGADSNRNATGAGADVGDRNLDSDTDSGGTGERDAAGRDAVPAADTELTVIDADGRVGEDVIDAEDLDAMLADEAPDPVDPLNPNPDEPEDLPPPQPVEEPDDDQGRDHERPRRFAGREAR